MQVVASVESGGEIMQRVVEIGIRAEVAHHGTVRNAADREPNILLSRDSRAGDDGKIAVATRKFTESEALCGPRTRE